MENPASGTGHSAVSYFRQDRSIRTDDHRLVVYDDGTLELYDHSSKAQETKNPAGIQPEMVAELRALLDARVSEVPHDVPE